MKLRKAVPVLLAGAMVLSSCSQTVEDAAVVEVYTAVEGYTVELSEIKKEMVYAGQVSPVETVNVVPKITSKVESIYFDVGDEVKEGDALFKLDEKNIRDQIAQLNAQLNQTQRGVDTARNALDTVTGGTYQSTINQLESSYEAAVKQVEGAEASLENLAQTLETAEKSLAIAQSALDNTRVLFEMDAVSQSALDQAEGSYNNAYSAYITAKTQYDSTSFSLEQAILTRDSALEALELRQGTITEESIRQSELQVNTAVAQRNVVSVSLQQMRETLEDTLVTSPISGVVSNKYITEAEYASNASPAFTIVNIDKVYVDVKVSELLINTLYTGQEVEVYISSLQEEALIGKVTTVSPAADATSTFPVKIEIDNTEGKIKPGMFSEVRFVREYNPNTVVVPRNAVMQDENNAYVYLIEEDTVNKVIVETGIDNGSQIEIVSGVAAGQRVVVKGQTYVTNGEKINDVTSRED